MINLTNTFCFKCFRYLPFFVLNGLYLAKQFFLENFKFTYFCQNLVSNEVGVHNLPDVSAATGRHKDLPRLVPANSHMSYSSKNCSYCRIFFTKAFNFHKHKNNLIFLALTFTLLQTTNPLTARNLSENMCEHPFFLMWLTPRLSFPASINKHNSFRFWRLMFSQKPILLICYFLHSDEPELAASSAVHPA